MNTETAAGTKTYEYIVYYHGNCADGFTSAWAMREHFNRVGISQERVEYYPSFYGKGLEGDPVDKHVYFVDFSVNKLALLDIAKIAKSVTVIDHHKSAQEELSGEFPENCHIIFDMDRSGAGLVWDTMMSQTRRPRLINYVEDRDLWKFELGSSKEIAEYIFSFGYTFDNWDKIARDLEAGSNECADAGAALLRKKSKDIAEMLDAATQLISVWSHRVPFCNLPYMWGSDAAHELLIKNPDAPFAGYYWIDKDGLLQCGLRSENRRMDVSKIAKNFGGGGHRNAAGFKARAIIDNTLISL